MEVIHLDHSAIPTIKEEHVMAIGFFDGVHLGHQKLLDEARDLAERKGCKFSVMTFSPHPSEVIRKDSDFQYLMTLPQKVAKMERLGVDTLFITKFDLNFASLQPTEFVQQYIRDINVCHVVVGFDFTFGFKAQGNTELLKRECSNEPWGVSIIPKKKCDEEKISSTRLRSMVKAGDFSSIPECLGEYYSIRVKIGVQKTSCHYTVHTDPKITLPASGIYDVEVRTPQGMRYGLLQVHEEKGFELSVLSPLGYSKDGYEMMFIGRSRKAKGKTIERMEEIVYG
ncbi:FAD synthetase family protein [Salinicoccus bachuensis]|uniref:FAD synthase n=1 Tax=Salinicoccus bachuensis TaxID=3136731 RepID=A0ABZ3CH77_9STAP